MKIALVQQDIVWGDPSANRARLDGLLANLGGIDLVLLPEMFSTGFVTTRPDCAEPLQNETLEWMKRKAAALDCAIGGSIAVKDGEMCRNRFHFVTPDGNVTVYDKKHLFGYGGENKSFTSGDEQVTVEWRGVRMRLAVCYDLRFPVWLRNKDDYDALLLVANWPDCRRLAWDTLTRARAIENECYVAVVNRCGKDISNNYDGGTAFINPYGEVIAAAEDGKEQVIIADLDLKVLNDYRAKFPVLLDADKFELI